MKNQAKSFNQSLDAIRQSPITIRFCSKSTPHVFYDHVLKTIQDSLKCLIAIGTPELIRQARLEMESLTAMLANAEARGVISGSPLERRTPDEIKSFEGVRP